MLFFSIVIPVYLDTDRLLLCLDALINQSFPKDEFEVLVVNNNPNQNIQIKFYYFNQLNLSILNEPQHGSYAARNKGISLAKGKVLVFTDSDCIPDKNWLKNSNKYFKLDINEELGILAGDIPLFYRDSKKLSPAEVYEKYTGFTQEAYVKGGHAITANWFTYTKVIKVAGGFNVSLKSNGDTELSARISKYHKIIFAPDVIVRHPARYYVKDIVYKYRRLIGGTYSRKFREKPLRFLGHILNFNYRRFRFAFKKFFTVPPTESWAIFMVCISINIGAWKEYISLIRGRDTKR